MRYLRQNTATIVTVGPFFDKTDGVTLETALTITNERISMTVDANDGSAPTLVLDNVTGATSGTNNDLNYITNNDAALMQLELSAANTNYVGRARVTITDAANHCPVFEDFTILPAQVYDSLIVGTDLLDANASQLGGTSQTGRDIGASVLLSPGTGAGQITLTSGAVTVGTNNDKTGYTASTVSDKTGYSISGTKTTLDALNDVSAATVNAQCDTAISDAALATAASIAALNDIAAGDVWDVTLASHLGTGSTGAALNAAGSAGDPWNTALPGAYGDGTAGKIIGTNLDATVSSRSTLTAAAVWAYVTEGTTTAVQMMRGMFAALLNLLSGAGTTTIKIRDIADTKDRITATVDVDGNRSAVTVDLT